MHTQHSQSVAPVRSRRRIVVGISGASGAIYGVGLLNMLRHAGVESHLAVSRSAQVTLAQELNSCLGEVAGQPGVASLGLHERNVNGPFTAVASVQRVRTPVPQLVN